MAAAAPKNTTPVGEAELKKWRAQQQARSVGAEAGKEELRSLWSRRDFLGRLGWAGFVAASILGLLAAMRSAFPRVLFLPPSKFKAGFPGDYVVGEVSEKFKQEYRTWIVRTKAGFYAIFAKCTHLGCTPRWLKAEQKFKCPCHGSGYYISGMNFEGPAPRPMDRFNISVADDGSLVVDKSVVYRMEPGVDPNEQHPESILKIA
ncbi:MAG: Rieske 2Fe-2S domain-containing protein [Candidatus Binataceae bacterium]